MPEEQFSFRQHARYTPCSLPSAAASSATTSTTTSRLVRASLPPPAARSAARHAADDEPSAVVVQRSLTGRPIVVSLHGRSLPSQGDDQIGGSAARMNETLAVRAANLRILCPSRPP